jgi:hypothetical protein
VARSGVLSGRGATGSSLPVPLLCHAARWMSDARGCHVGPATIRMHNHNRRSGGMKERQIPRAHCGNRWRDRCCYSSFRCSSACWRVLLFPSSCCICIGEGLSNSTTRNSVFPLWLSGVLHVSRIGWRHWSAPAHHTGQQRSRPPDSVLSISQQ